MPRRANAADQIAATGERSTAARIAVLDALIEAKNALSHAELQGLMGRSVDRVTLYRVLEWLVAHGLAHRRTDGNGVWRFLPSDGSHDTHAHFSCTRCGVVSCLPVEVRPKLRLPAGYRRESVDLTVRGLCAGCAR